MYKLYCQNQNCALYNKDIEILYITRRKALRILCKLPYQTQSVLLPHVTGIPPLDVGGAKRYFKYVHISFNHDNSLVRFLYHKTMHMYTDSIIGQNI